MFKLISFFILSVILCYTSLLNAQNSIIFKHLYPTYNNNPVGINSIVQGPLGNIWMSYSKGILVYNGYEYNRIAKDVIFRNNKGKERILKMIDDDLNNIWILTSSGRIIKYNSANDKFECISHPSLKDDAITAIVSKGDKIIMASENGNIYRYSNSTLEKIATVPEINEPFNFIKDLEMVGDNELFVSTNSNLIIQYSINTKKINTFPGIFSDFKNSFVLKVDHNDKIWIGTDKMGILVYDVYNKEFVQDKLFEKNNFKKTLFINLFCDSEGFMWAGTDGSGLYKINTEDGKTINFKRKRFSEFSLNSNTIINIYEDKMKNIWALNKYGELNIIPNNNNSIKYHTGSGRSFPVKVLSVFKDSHKNLWIGTDGEGLTKVTYSKDSTVRNTRYFKNTPSRNGFYIESITEDPNSAIWFGTYQNGLWVFDKKKKQFKQIKVFNSRKKEDFGIMTVFTDHKGRIWATNDYSINVYNSDQKLLASFEYGKNGLFGLNCESIIEDHNGDIWLGINNGGLFKFKENNENLKESKFINYQNDHEFTNIEVYAIKSMTSLSNDTIWLINSKGKLIKFNTKNKKYYPVNPDNEKDFTNYAGVLEQDSKNIWVSSNRGIFHFNNKGSIIRSFHTSDGLQSNSFSSRSAFKDKQGLMYFGGNKGLNYFDPKTIRKRKSNARLYISSIEVLNVPADSIIPSQISEGISHLKKIKLEHQQSSFSFKFYAVDNILEPHFYYAYRLKGFDDKWVNPHSERTATYTNLPPGNYTFEVKAGTREGLWDIPPKKIDINIQYPFWNRPAAYLLYLFLFVLLTYSIIRWYSARKELLLEKISYKKESELHDLKMKFFAKMSHEIQTPITLILGSIQAMVDKAEINGDMLLKQRLDIVTYNANRLSRIARELTLVRNEELGRLKLVVTKNDLFKNIHDISQSFKEIARNKKIDFAVSCPRNLTDTWYDKGKLEHIVYNLLSNAFKFTRVNGSIQLNVIPVSSKEKIKISISDSGSGIKKEELDKIFELFYQSNMGKKRFGSGIGLALTKEIVDLHKGSIEVRSNQEYGTVFEVIIPITEQAYDESERIITQDSVNPVEEETSEENKKNYKNFEKTVLIVEDNYELQTFLKNLLKTEFNILLASDGEEGYQYAKSSLPNLILSDLMMPNLNGIEMCKRLQNNKLTQDIPVILITAKNSTQSKIEGLKSGAIEYINKPFNTNELKLKIHNILVSRERSISKLRKEIISQPELKIKESQDEIFLKNLVKAINSRIDDPNLKIEELAESLNMSYSSLYRKCQTTTGKSIVDYIRMVRLKKAALLIVKYGYNISETSFMTGFNDPKYFSKSFKKYFKKTPSTFKKEAIKSDLNEYLMKYNLIDID